MGYVGMMPCSHRTPPHFVPTKTRRRHDGWTPERQVAFIKALAACGCVTEAAAAVGVSHSAAYALRVRPEAQQFRMAWDAALDLGVRRLADECFSRAMHGTVVPHYYKGEIVGEHRRYDSKLAMFLLRYRDPLRYAASLDQMVYSGHHEGAGVRFARARNAVADEAHGLADGAMLDPCQPYAIEPITEAAMRPPDHGVPPTHVPDYVAEQRRARAAAADDPGNARARLAELLETMTGRMAEAPPDLPADEGGGG